MQYDTADELQNAARALGVLYIPCAAVALSRKLPTIAAGDPAAPPSQQNMTLEQFNPATLLFSPVDPAGHHPPGLYRLHTLGRRGHLLRRADGWRHCDLPSGVFLELARRPRSALQWRTEIGRGRAEYGQLFVDLGAPLPSQHMRALALCSGLLPRFSTSARTAIYDNVPREVAERVAASLHQHLDDA